MYRLFYGLCWFLCFHWLSALTIRSPNCHCDSLSTIVCSTAASAADLRLAFCTKPVYDIRIEAEFFGSTLRGIKKLFPKLRSIVLKNSTLCKLLDSDEICSNNITVGQCTLLW